MGQIQITNDCSTSKYQLTTFTNVNRLFVSSFQRIAGENNTTKDRRDSFSHYYVPNVRMKDFNVLIDGKRFFDFPVKNEEEC